MAVDVTVFWRLRLQGCPTVHYHAEAGRALPAIPLGLIARVGSVGSCQETAESAPVMERVRT